MSIPTIITEDEPLSRAFLKNLLTEYCPQLTVVAMPATEAEAVAAIESLQPKLVFMDIELQQGTGFEVLQKTWQQHYHIIFTTALDYSSIRAIKFSGVDYLQKPIDIDALQLLIEKICCDSPPTHGKIAVQHLLHTLDNYNEPHHIFINAPSGRHYIKLSEIIFIQAENSNCIFHTVHGAVISVGCSIKDYEKLLNELGFFRTDPDYIIHTGSVTDFSKTAEGSVTMINDLVIPVSPKKAAQLLTILSARS